MLLPPTNLFLYDFVTEYDLHRFREYLYENSSNSGTENVHTSVMKTTGPLLMDILMKEGGEGKIKELRNLLYQDNI